MRPDSIAVAFGASLPAAFGRYTLLERVGGGGMASVYRASLSVAGGFEKEVAVKVIRQELAEDPQFTAMFLDEARLSARLNHANIVQTFDFGQEEGTHFIAMELVRGRTLAALLKIVRAKGERLGLAPSLQVAAELGKALGYAHRLAGPDGKALGIVHRDVSPQNVLVSREGEVKLADFGIAKAAMRSHVTQPGRVRGKCAYMAPEQIRGQEVDGRADVFALGVVLWECLTCAPLFDGQSDGAVLMQVLEKEILPPSWFAPEVPSSVDELVMRLLAREPADRPDSSRAARELADLTFRLVRSQSEIDLAELQRRLASGTSVFETPAVGPRQLGLVAELAGAGAGEGEGTDIALDGLSPPAEPAEPAEAAPAPAVDSGAETVVPERRRKPSADVQTKALKARATETPPPARAEAAPERPVTRRRWPVLAAGAVTALAVAAVLGLVLRDPPPLDPAIDKESERVEGSAEEVSPEPSAPDSAKMAADGVLGTEPAPAAEAGVAHAPEPALQADAVSPPEPALVAEAVATEPSKAPAEAHAPLAANRASVHPLKSPAPPAARPKPAAPGELLLSARGLDGASASVEGRGRLELRVFAPTTVSVEPGLRTVTFARADRPGGCTVRLKIESGSRRALLFDASGVFELVGATRNPLPCVGGR
ncbi:serine/threonine-protein kinase [Vulgatibacter incomptus]|uniref:Serine/threonine-protein kinase PknB n=1 Tax=Vulgatibacter incomptus TaxID=1391653 RepID=A0A0K1PDB8_9BACT|nr:serine/threonine-protein kinase [Vulgatibacter incomptus]AKU91114.1 Serine/threonine-protein kinase PknB [Vulgatibacter incomptus]